MKCGESTTVNEFCTNGQFSGAVMLDETGSCVYSTAAAELSESEIVNGEAKTILRSAALRALFPFSCRWKERVCAAPFVKDETTDFCVLPNCSEEELRAHSGHCVRPQRDEGCEFPQTLDAEGHCTSVCDRKSLVNEDGECVTMCGDGMRLTSAGDCVALATSCDYEKEFLEDGICKKRQTCELGALAPYDNTSDVVCATSLGYGESHQRCSAKSEITEKDECKRAAALMHQEHGCFGRTQADASCSDETTEAACNSKYQRKNNSDHLGANQVCKWTADGTCTALDAMCLQGVTLDDVKRMVSEPQTDHGRLDEKPSETSVCGLNRHHGKPVYVEPSMFEADKTNREIMTFCKP